MKNQNKTSIKLRETLKTECMLLFKWIQDSEVREAAFSNKKISLDEHKRWFDKKTDDSNTIMYTAVLNNPIGQIRFEIEDDIANVSIVLAKEYRGRGLGKKIIKKGTKKLLSNQEVKEVKACIKKNNKASIKAFQKAGYEKSAIKEIKGQEAVIYVFEK